MYTISTGAVRAWAGRGAGVPPSPDAQRRSPPLAAARQRSQTLPDLPERSTALGELRRRIAAGHQPSCSHKSAGASRQQIQVCTRDGSRCTRMQQGGQDTWQTHNYHRPHSTRCFAQRCAMCCPPAALGRGSQPTPAPLHQESGAAALMRGMGPGKGSTCKKQGLFRSPAAAGGSSSCCQTGPPSQASTVCRVCRPRRSAPVTLM